MFTRVHSCVLLDTVVFLTFPYPVPVPKNCVIFIGCNFESRVSQVGLHKQKNNTTLDPRHLDQKLDSYYVSVSLLRRGGQSQGCALSYGARSPEATKAWPRATENIVQVTQPGDVLVLVSWYKVKKLEFITCDFVARSAPSRPKKNVPLAKKLLRSTCM